MTWRAPTWEFVISALSWIVAIGALAFIIMFVAYDAVKSRRRQRR